LGALYAGGLLLGWARAGWTPGAAGAPTARAWDLRVAATILITLLTSPHLPLYELTLWLGPGVLVWRALKGPGAGGQRPELAPPSPPRSAGPQAPNLARHPRPPAPGPQLPAPNLQRLRIPILAGGYLAGGLALAGALWTPVQLAALAAAVGGPGLWWLAGRLAPNETDSVEEQYLTPVTQDSE